MNIFRLRPPSNSSNACIGGASRADEGKSAFTEWIILEKKKLSNTTHTHTTHVQGKQVKLT